MKNVGKSCLRAHILAVEFSLRQGRNGRCDKCSCAAVQIEVHVFLYCLFCQDLCSLKKNIFVPILPVCPRLFSV